MKILTATLDNGSTIDYIDDKIGEGGMKDVYFSKDKKNVICFYKPSYQSDTKFIKSQTERLEKIIKDFNPTLDPSTSAYFQQLYCWPTAIIVSPKFGLVAPTYPSDYFFESGRFQGKEKEGKWFSSQKLRKMLPPSEQGNLLTYLMLCKRMSCAVRKLHATGLAHSDLSNKNVLVDPQRGKSIVIDIDTLVVPNLFPPDVLGTKGYFAPEVLKSMKSQTRILPSNWTDLHALGVLIYEYIFQRHPLDGCKIWNDTSAEEDELLAYGEKAIFVEHHTDKTNRPNPLNGVSFLTIDHLGPYLKENFNRCFIDGLHNFTKRPTASSWELALAKTLDRLIDCTQCKQYYVFLDNQQRPSCPYCKHNLDKPLPIFDFYYEFRDGQYIAEKHIFIAKHSARLYEWHIFCNKTSDENARIDRLAYVQFNNNSWYLVNQMISSGMVCNNNLVPIGGSIKLEANQEIIASKDSKSRLFKVRFTH
jgi:serine/threonine protein kinase